MSPSTESDLVVRVSRRLACSASRLWTALSRPSALEIMHPFVARHETPDLPMRLGARDSVVYHSGRRLERRCVGFVDGRHVELDVTIHGLPGEPAGSARVKMDLDPEGEACRVTVTITVPPESDDFREIRERMINQYLDQMLQGFAFHCETGETVRRDQFGSHPFYS